MTSELGAGSLCFLGHGSLLLPLFLELCAEHLVVGSDHYIERQRESPVPAHLDSRMKLVELVHLHSESLSAKSSISFGECSDLGLKSLISVGGIDQLLLNGLGGFHSDSHGELVTKALI